MLEELFKTPITCRVIEYFILNTNVEMNPTDMSKAIGVAPYSAGEAFKPCVKFGLIKESHVLGPSTLYKTNTKSPLYAILKKLIMEVSVHKHVVEMNGEVNEQEN